MGNFFNVDNVVFSTLSKIFDILFLSIIWLILCIPIITIGPASTAMYYTVVKVIRRERGYLMREFFKSFRLNFKRAMIVGVIFTVILIVLSFDLSYAWNLVILENNKASLLFGIFIAITFLVMSFGVYVFPILSRFDMTVKQLLKAATFMSMKHLPYTFVMVVVVVGSFFISIYVPLLMFFLPALSLLINSFLMEPIFKKYMPESDGPGEETGKDEWYLD